MTPFELTPEKAWELATISGLSLMNFLEQNLDDKELAVVVEGFLMWAKKEWPGYEIDSHRAITTVFNNYTANCVKEGGRRLAAQERVVDVFRTL
jgi:hypothetical protein